MATYRNRKKKDGSISVTAVIRKNGHSITETFNEKTKTKAMQAAMLWVAETEDQIYRHKKNSPDAAKIRLADFFTAYFEHLDLTGRKRYSTVRNERFSATQILRLLKPTTYLCDITTPTIAAFRDERLREGVGASKIRSEIALISCLFKFAIQEKGFNLENPVGPGKMWRPPAPRGKIDSLTEEEIRRFLDECRLSRNNRLAAYVAVLLNTGMRPGEAAQLRVKDIDMVRRSIHLEETKNGTSRDIPLTKTAFLQISPLVTGRDLQEFVFYSGKVLPKVLSDRPAQMFRESFDKAAARAGVDRITRHGMRHTAATHMLKNKIPLRTIAEVLGHKTLQMAMKYTHPDEDELRAAVDTLDGLIE
jgi:integrase